MTTDMWAELRDELTKLLPHVSAFDGINSTVMASTIRAQDIAALLTERDALREALETCAESLAFARERLGMCGEGDSRDRKADAPDDIGSLSVLNDARTLLAALKPKGAP
jgi:hypothetical protein